MKKKKRITKCSNNVLTCKQWQAKTKCELNPKAEGCICEVFVKNGEVY